MLEAKGLSRQFGTVTALDALDLKVEKGEVFCLLGANGAGKTTTINLFLGFLEPSSGAALIGGLNVQKNPLETKRLVAYIPEQVALYRDLSGAENLDYMSALGGARQSAEDALKWLQQAGLSAQASLMRASTYSKGMRQRVAIAIALARGARALLLDEPTSGLDPKAANELSRSLRTMSDAGVAVLMATHDLFRAKETASRVGIMKGGKLVQTLSTKEIGHSDLERIFLDHMHD